MSIRSSRQRLVTFALASMVALVVGVGACKDPNPTFVFDAASDGAKDGSRRWLRVRGIRAGAAPEEAAAQAATAGRGGGTGGTGGSAGGGRCLVIRYTGHTVFLAALSVCPARRAPSPPRLRRRRPPPPAPAEPGGHRRPPGAPPTGRGAPARLPRRGAADSGGGAHGRHRTGGAHRVAQTRAARGGGRQAGEGGAQADHRRQGLLDGPARQVVRAQDSRASCRPTGASSSTTTRSRPTTPSSFVVFVLPSRGRCSRSSTTDCCRSSPAR